MTAKLTEGQKRDRTIVVYLWLGMSDKQLAEANRKLREMAACINERRPSVRMDGRSVGYSTGSRPAS
jgi:hypothetical protein